jgi:hypothetical protein
MIRLVGNVLLGISTVEAITFCLLYHLSSTWWRTEAGRHLMAFTAVIAAVLSLVMVRIVIGADPPWFAWLRVAVFGLVPWVLGWRLWLLWRAQIARDRTR